MPLVTNAFVLQEQLLSCCSCATIITTAAAAAVGTTTSSSSMQPSVAMRTRQCSGGGLFAANAAAGGGAATNPFPTGESHNSRPTPEPLFPSRRACCVPAEQLLGSQTAAHTAGLTVYTGSRQPQNACTARMVWCNHRSAVQTPTPSHLGAPRISLVSPTQPNHSRFPCRGTCHPLPPPVGLLVDLFRWDT